MASLKASSITFTESLTSTDEYIPIPSTSIIGYVSRKDMIDEEKERALLTQQKEKLEAELKRSQALLSNENFLKKASSEKIQTEKDKHASYQVQYDAIVSKLK